jgi:hypothetical protein
VPKAASRHNNGKRKQKRDANANVQTDKRRTVSLIGSIMAKQNEQEKRKTKSAKKEIDQKERKRERERDASTHAETQNIHSAPCARKAHQA